MTGAPPDLSGFGGTTLVHPLGGGNRATVWRVRWNGRDCVAKSTGHGEAALRWLGPIQAAARAAGFTVPALIAGTDGRLAPGGWTLEPFVDSRPCPDLAAFDRHIARLHAATRGIGPRPGLAAVIRPAPGLPPAVARAVRRALHPHRHGPMGAIHGDLTAENLRFGADGPVLIDWDEARRDLLLFDRRCTCPDVAARPGVARAHLAAEIVQGWRAEPAHARVLARALASAAPRRAK